LVWVNIKILAISLDRTMGGQPSFFFIKMCKNKLILRKRYGWKTNKIEVRSTWQKSQTKFNQTNSTTVLIFNDTKIHLECHYNPTNDFCYV
jgi:hypothetical protein